VPCCLLCASDGVPLYRGLRDRMYRAPGEWSLAQCPRPGCGLIWLDPMPLASDIGVAYEDYYTHACGAPSRHALSAVFVAAKWGYLANAWGYTHGVGKVACLLGLLAYMYPGRKTELDFSVMWLEGRSKGRLLDVGAGSGSLVERMCKLGWKAEGLDFDRRSVESARSRGLTFHLGGLPDQHFPEASFDAITMSHSIEHVHDPVGWLAEARRILKPGGRLAIATPNARSWLHRRFGAHWFALDPPRHLHLFNRDTIAAALRKAGFEAFSVFTSIRDVNGAWRGSRAIQRHGNHDMLARPSVAMSLVSRFILLAVAIASLADVDAGEELVALARR
jgi:2-polyprenyl-3-methyl-5-hydroxy-6-metoxy-1,4-benzoquinol methylase